MPGASRVTGEEAALHNASLGPSASAVLLDLDWSLEPAGERDAPPRRYTYPRSLYTNYLNLIALMGLAAFISVPSEPVGRYTPNIVGVVFGGGRDMHPRFYNEEVDGSVIDEMSELRYPFALQQYRWAQGRVPVLGICWGSQFLAVAGGGALVQDLPAERRHLHTLVPLALQKDSWLQGAVATSKMMSNCNHHQGFKRIPPAYRVVALDDDGAPHAFESTEGVLELGFLGHPERLLGDAGTRMMTVKFGALCREIDAARRKADPSDDPDDEERISAEETASSVGDPEEIEDDEDAPQGANPAD